MDLHNLAYLTLQFLLKNVWLFLCFLTTAGKKFMISSYKKTNFNQKYKYIHVAINSLINSQLDSKTVSWIQICYDTSTYFVSASGLWS